MNKAIGIDVGGTNLKSGLVSESGRLDNLRYDATESKKGPKHVISNLCHAIENQIEAVGRDKISGIGIGCAGQVDVKKGIVYDPPNLPDWHRENLRQIVQDAFELPVSVDNDANVAALAEAVHGAGRDVENMLLVTLGTGVGGGLILRREIYHGAIGTAGEFGHVIIDFDGPVCNCGQKGCVERYVGADWMVERAIDDLVSFPQSTLNQTEAGGSTAITPKRIAHAAQAGDPLAIKALREVGFYLGVALGSVINLLNLDLIIIGGGISKSGPILMQAIEKSMHAHAMSIPRSLAQIATARLGENAGVIGAGELVHRHHVRR